MADDVKFGVTAEDVGFAAAMAEMQTQAKEASEQIKGAFEGITGTFEKIQSAFLAFTAALAGGEAFKEMISSTVAASSEAVKMGRALGIGATEASQLKVGLDSVFVSTEDFNAAGGKISQMLKKNESAFQDLGVATRDSSGNLRNALDIQLDTNEALLKFSEGTDRNVEGVKIYGKAWASVQGTLKLTPAVLEEAKIKADELGLTVGAENVAAAKRFKTAMNSTHEVLEGVEKVISEALMPVLSAMGEWFAEHGPAVINAFRASIYAIEYVFIEFKGVIVNWVDSIAGSLDIAMAYMHRFQAVAVASMTLNPGKVKAAWEAGTQDIINTTKMANDIVKQDADATAKAVADALESNSGQQTKIERPKGGEKSEGGDDKDKSQMAAQEEKLEAFKANFAKQTAAQGQFIDFSKAEEEAYWQAVLNTTKLSAADQIAIKKKIDTDGVAVAKEGFTNELAALKGSESEYKNNLEAKLAIAKEYAAKIAAASQGGDQKEAQAAAGEVLAIERELQAQRTVIAQTGEKAREGLELSQIAAQRAAAQSSAALGNMNQKQLLAKETEFEAEKYAIQAQSMTRQLQLAQQGPDANVEKAAAIQAQILALSESHEAAMEALTAKSALYQRQQYQDLFKSINSGFASSLSSLFKGTATISQTLHSMIQSVGAAMAQMAAKNIANMLLAATISKLMASQEKKDNASAAFGAAYQSAAKIPYVGWILGPIAGAAAYAAVMSAEGGYDIPAGVNPVTQLHEKEMVLPKQEAETIRNLGENGGGVGGDTHYHINAIDSKSFHSALQANKASVSDAVQSHMRSTGRLAPRH